MSLYLKKTRTVNVVNSDCYVVTLRDLDNLLFSLRIAAVGACSIILLFLKSKIIIKPNIFAYNRLN